MPHRILFQKQVEWEQNWKITETIITKCETWGNSKTHRTLGWHPLPLSDKQKKKNQ